MYNPDMVSADETGVPNTIPSFLDEDAITVCDTKARLWVYEGFSCKINIINNQGCKCIA